MRSLREFRGPSLRGLENARNPSYLGSVGYGLQRGVFYAPENFLRTLGPVLMAVVGYVALLLSALALLVLGFAAWIGVQLSIVVMGLCGRLSPISRARDNQSVVN